LIYWYVLPTLAVFQHYRGENKFYELISSLMWLKCTQN